MSNTHKLLELPQFNHGHDELYYVSINDAQDFIIQEWNQKFDELEKRLRIFETVHDHCVLPGLFMVGRIDGRNFTRLTRELHHFDAPFDARMRDYMVETTRHLLQCGFRILYGWTQSDKISLLFYPSDETFEPKLRKLNLILAGAMFRSCWEMSWIISTGEARMRIEMPGMSTARGFFVSRGKSAEVATPYLARLSIAEKNEHLFRHGTNLSQLPDWQKRGIGLLWETYDKAGTNLLTGETVIASRRGVQVEFNFPMKGDSSAWICELIDRELAASASAGVFDPLVEMQ